MNKRQHLAPLAGMLLAVVLLAACQGHAAPPPQPDSTGDAAQSGPPISAAPTSAAPTSAAPTSAPTEAASPTPSPTASGVDAVYLTSEGLGSLRIGQPIPDANGYVSWRASESCDGGLWSPEKSTLHESGDHLSKYGFLALPDPKSSRTAPLARILITDDSIPTKSGMRVGDSLAKLTSTFTNFDDEYTLPETGARFFEIDGTAGSVVFMVGGQNYGYVVPKNEIGAIAAVRSSEDLSDSARQMVQAPCDE